MGGLQSRSERGESSIHEVLLARDASVGINSTQDTMPLVDSVINQVQSHPEKYQTKSIQEIS